MWALLANLDEIASKFLLNDWKSAKSADFLKKCS